MKKYTLTATGMIRLAQYGQLTVDDTDINKKLVDFFKLDDETWQKKFNGKVEITITDLTEPLKIDAQEV